MSDSYLESFIKGLRIAQAYDAKIGLSADHDIVYVELDPASTSVEDKKTLDTLGFHECPDCDCWGWFT